MCTVREGKVSAKKGRVGGGGGGGRRELDGGVLADSKVHQTNWNG